MSSKIIYKIYAITRLFSLCRYKEECHTIASQSELKMSELKQKMENLRGRNEQLQSEIGDVKRKEAEVCFLICQKCITFL